MTDVAKYAPGPAAGAEIRKDGDTWTLVLVRELKHAPAKVWAALTDPAQIREWAPYDADRNLGAEGPVKLSTFGTPLVSDTRVSRAVAQKALEFDWGGGTIRWELAPLGKTGTRLTLWANIDKNWIAMGAAGWHVCLDVMDRLLAGTPIGRIAGPETMKLDGWRRLHQEYAKQFGVAR